MSRSPNAGNSYGGYGGRYGGGGFASAAAANPYGASRFDNLAASAAFSNTYATPGWQRAQQNRTEATDRNWGTRSGHRSSASAMAKPIPAMAPAAPRQGRTIDGELVAKSVADTPSPFNVGDRVFHQKFGNGNVAAIEGNKLTIDFDKAGQKKVLDGFVSRV